MSQLLGSWGRYPSLPQTAHACNWREDVLPTWRAVLAGSGSTLAYGNGRSYGDSCLAASNHVLLTKPLDRFIAADWHSGVVRVESGMTLDALLQQCVPRGWFLPVTPGTKFATIGGALANDVHGKNHHVKGTFGLHVLSFGLLRSDGSEMVCAPDQNLAMFSATIGGLGLTGVVLWVELQLAAIRSSAMQVMSQRFDNLAEFFDLSAHLDLDYEYTVAWVDCLATGQSRGRGVFFAANHSDSGSLEVHTAPHLRMPLTPPVPAINQLTLTAFNQAYFHLHRNQPVSDRARVEYGPFFYPLDGILEWNRIYGRKGFQQYQCVVPGQSAAESVAALLERISTSGRGSFLAVLKLCGDIASPGLLSFPMPGVSLALDFAQDEALNRELFPALDAIVRAAGGRLYPAKDAHMAAADFQAFYPRWHELEALRDTGLQSHF